MSTTDVLPTFSCFHVFTCVRFRLFSDSLNTFGCSITWPKYPAEETSDIISNVYFPFQVLKLKVFDAFSLFDSSDHFNFHWVRTSTYIRRQHINLLSAQFKIESTRALSIKILLFIYGTKGNGEIGNLPL